jgi:hypothetical protein
MAQKSASNTANDTGESAKAENITGPTRPAYALSQGVEPRHTTNDPSNSFPQDIKNIITKLRITVDHIDSPRNYARDLIHELARQLDERRLCERGRISIKIKEILKDKIQVGKITKEWISECLPEDYKRKYTKSKSKLSLLSKQDKNKDTQPTAKQNQEQLAALVQTSGEDATVKESPLMTTSPTLPDTHDPSSGSMGKSPCENYSAKAFRIKKLEDENRELHIRCQRAESNNTELVLQLTRQGKYINEILNQDKDRRSQPSSTTNVNLMSHPSEKYIQQECTGCLELQDEVTQLREALQRISISTADQNSAAGIECIIPKEEYELVKSAMDRSENAIFVKCDETKKFARAVADVDN